MNENYFLLVIFSLSDFSLAFRITRLVVAFAPPLPGSPGPPLFAEEGRNAFLFSKFSNIIMAMNARDEVLFWNS